MIIEFTFNEKIYFANIEKMEYYEDIWWVINTLEKQGEEGVNAKEELKNDINELYGDNYYIRELPTFETNEADNSIMLMNIMGDYIFSESNNTLNSNNNFRHSPAYNAYGPGPGLIDVNAKIIKKAGNLLQGNIKKKNRCKKKHTLKKLKKINTFKKGGMNLENTNNNKNTEMDELGQNILDSITRNDEILKRAGWGVTTNELKDGQNIMGLAKVGHAYNNEINPNSLFLGMWPNHKRIQFKLENKIYDAVIDCTGSHYPILTFTRMLSLGSRTGGLLSYTFDLKYIKDALMDHIRRSFSDYIVNELPYFRALRNEIALMHLEPILTMDPNDGWINSSIGVRVGEDPHLDINYLREMRLPVIVRVIPSNSNDEFRPVEENILDLNEPLSSQTDMKVNYQPYPMNSERLKWMIQFYYDNKEYNAVISQDGYIFAFLKPFPMCENGLCLDQNQVQEELIRQLRNNNPVIIDELPFFDDDQIKQLDKKKIYAKFRKILNEHGDETGELILVGSGDTNPNTGELREWGDIDLIIPHRIPFTDDYENIFTTVKARLIPGVIPENVHYERLNEVSAQNSVAPPIESDNLAPPEGLDVIKNTTRVAQSAVNLDGVSSGKGSDFKWEEWKQKKEESVEEEEGQGEAETGEAKEEGKQKNDEEDTDSRTVSYFSTGGNRRKNKNQKNILRCKNSLRKRKIKNLKKTKTKKI